MTLTRAIANRRKLKLFGRPYAVNLKREVQSVKSYERRLAKIEAARPRLFADILALIGRHAFFDEITDHERERYCCYIGVDRRVFEEVNQAVAGNLHVLLRQIEPPTPDELRSVIEELEIIINQ